LVDARLYGLDFLRLNRFVEVLPHGMAGFDGFNFGHNNWNFSMDAKVIISETQRQSVFSLL
jgi:hypothetical protein